ncbi:MAG: hypothetical protein RBU37_28350 [Myxococcota bacterium]|jgi:hypothetical protein|nr:hypothetical protein [Myxococcota bacterium]
MKVVHRITIRPTSKQRTILQELGLSVPPGIELPGGGTPLVAMDVEEGHPNWAALDQLFREWGAGDLVSTRFSKDEVLNAKWLVLVPDWHHGYPQPKDGVFGYRQATYALTDWCKHCGIGLRQSAPFQMKGEPKWGRRSILQLNWVFDEFFVTPATWHRVFAPHDIECRAVMNSKGMELETVVQLVVEETVGIQTAALDSECCAQCNRTKYLPTGRGRFPALRGEPSAAMVKTAEVFGSGGRAHHEVLVSQAIAHALLDNEVRGVSLRPVENE